MWATVTLILHSLSTYCWLGGTCAVLGLNSQNNSVNMLITAILCTNMRDYAGLSTRVYMYIIIYICAYTVQVLYMYLPELFCRVAQHRAKAWVTAHSLSAYTSTRLLFVSSPLHPLTSPGGGVTVVSFTMATVAKGDGSVEIKHQSSTQCKQLPVHAYRTHTLLRAYRLYM